MIIDTEMLNTEMSYDELHKFFMEFIDRRLKELFPLTGSDVESDIINEIGVMISECTCKSNVRKSVMVLIAIFMHLAKKS